MRAQFCFIANLQPQSALEQPSAPHPVYEWPTRVLQELCGEQFPSAKDHKSQVIPLLGSQSVPEHSVEGVDLVSSIGPLPTLCTIEVAGKHWDHSLQRPSCGRAATCLHEKTRLARGDDSCVWEHMMHELALTDQGQGVASLCVKYAPLQHLGDQAQNNALQLKSFRGASQVTGMQTTTKVNRTRCSRKAWLVQVECRLKRSLTCSSLASSARCQTSCHRSSHKMEYLLLWQLKAGMGGSTCTPGAFLVPDLGQAQTTDHRILWAFSSLFTLASVADPRLFAPCACDGKT